MNPHVGDLIEHRIGGGIYKVKAVLQLVDTPEVYLWRGIIENINTHDSMPYSLSKASYWETFWNHVSTSKPKFKVGNLYRSSKSGNVWQIIHIHTIGDLSVSRYNPITNTVSTCVAHMCNSFAQNSLVPFNPQEETTEERELFT